MNETHYPYSRYLRETFGAKTYKIVVASGLSCPNRDGTLGIAGCAFCDERGSGSYFGMQGHDVGVSEQIRARLPAVRERFSASCFLAYFQSYTNTHDARGVEHLRSLYEEALSVPEISGLCIGTRPDCLPDAVIDLLAELSERTYISIELGVQSFEDQTLQWLERGHDGDCSIKALERLRARAPRAHTCAHLIFGSPTDSATAARDAALTLNDLGVRGAKPHQLMVLERTRLASRWREERFAVLSIEEYAARVADFIEHLSPAIYLERLCATATHSQECLAPEWSRGRWEPHNRMREILAERGCQQGALPHGSVT